MKRNDEMVVPESIRRQMWKSAAHARGDANHSFMVADFSGGNTTKAMLVNCELDAEETISGLIKRAGIDNKRYKMDNEFLGTSKCNTDAGDVYDKDTGYGIATKRCLSKYHKQLNAKLLKFLGDARGLCAYVEHYMEKQKIDYSSVMSVEDMKRVRYEQHK